MLKINVHDHVIRKRFNECGLFEEVAWRRPLLPETKSQEFVDLQT